MYNYNYYTNIKVCDNACVYGYTYTYTSIIIYPRKHYTTNASHDTFFFLVSWIRLIIFWLHKNYPLSIMKYV